ncbi:ROK family glucokinase [Bacillota bacterium]
MYQIGFDIGGTDIKAGIVNDDMKIVGSTVFPFPKGQPCDCVISAMAARVKELSGRTGIAADEFKSIGMATAGSVNIEKGMIINAHNLGFHNAPIVREMSKHFPGMPVNLANDADAAAIAELRGGVFLGKKTAVLLTLGTGVGGGIIINGRLFTGGQGHGNELGHMTIMQGGPLCTCGNRGCIESLCAATWLLERGKESASKNPKGLIYEKCAGKIDEITAKVVVDSAKEKDPDASGIFNAYLDSLSSALASIAVLLDPEVIALGGGISLAGDFLFEPLRELVKGKSFFKIYHEILPAKYGNTAGIIGAAMLSKEY